MFCALVCTVHPKWLVAITKSGTPCKPLILDLPRCHAAPCEEKVREKRSVHWDASLSLHLSSLNSQSGEPYMNSADRSTIVNALNDIQSHLRTEEAKVDKNGLELSWLLQLVCRSVSTGWDLGLQRPGDRIHLPPLHPLSFTATPAPWLQPRDSMERCTEDNPHERGLKWTTPSACS